jgi:hypothetical protein
MILTATIRLPADVLASLTADDIRRLEHEVSLRMEEEFKRLAVADRDDAATDSKA